MSEIDVDGLLASTEADEALRIREHQTVRAHAMADAVWAQVFARELRTPSYAEDAIAAADDAHDLVLKRFMPKREGDRDDV